MLAENRHYLARAKARVREHARIGNRHYAEPVPAFFKNPRSKPECIALWVQSHYRNRHPCSCSMCCNKRRDPYAKRRERLTMQERRADDAEQAS